MKKKSIKEIEWLEFELLQEFPQVKHGVFLKGKGEGFGDVAGLFNQKKALNILGIE